MTDFIVRPATIDDAASAVAVMRASITELCVADHHDDPATLARWLRNKTTDHFMEWLANPSNHILVAEEAIELSGVAALNRNGDLGVCYVCPGRQRCGIGHALLMALEAQAARWGLDEIRLTSSTAARAFYERHGYRSTGNPIPQYGVLIDYPYAKPLCEP
ncbi:MAG TPA: GNAT family N-acetyltransferase [Polyangiaceae bacterium]|jgi:GNAT superfamily N-acetyltransferase|nr:GNAT family N-acetyltransferase [Polyangiaceae bacterium]